MAIASIKMSPHVDYYIIADNGSITPNVKPQANSYIAQSQLHFLFDPSSMLHIKNKYGEYIGVIKDDLSDVKCDSYDTPKTLLGVAKEVFNKG